MGFKISATVILAVLFFSFVATAADADPDNSFFDLCTDNRLDFDARYTVVAILHAVGVAEPQSTDACRRGQTAMTAREPEQPMILRFIKDPSPLAHLKNIESVIFYSSEKMDLRVLAKNRHLHAVVFDRGGPSELGPLGEMKNLTDLTATVGANPVNLHGLSGAPLKVLILRGAQPNSRISNLEDLGAIRTLEDLSLNDIAVPSLDFARHLLALRSLLVNVEFGLGRSESSYSDLRPLEGLHHLVDLELGRGKITSIDSLKHLPKLHTLTLGGNAIADFRPLAHLTNLEFLSLVDDGITSVSQIPVVKSVKNLDLSKNAIQDVKPLAEWTHLRALYLTANKIREVNPISGLKNLDVLSVEWNRIENFNSLDGLKAAHRDHTGQEIQLRIFGETAEYQSRP